MFLYLLSINAFVDVLFLPLNTTIIHLFIVMLLKTIKFDLHKKNVLVSISFICIDLFNCRRRKEQYFKRSMRVLWEKEIELLLHWLTQLCIYLYVHCIWFFVCDLIGEISLNYFLVPRMPVGDVRRKWPMLVCVTMSTQPPVTLPNCWKSNLRPSNELMKRKWRIFILVGRISKSF